jgi:FkbM family methyltransferase
MSVAAPKILTPVASPVGSFSLSVPEGNDPKLAVYRDGQLPPQVLTLVQALRTTTPAGAKVLDLGGYIGGFGIAAATAGYQVVIVEANPHNAACIRESLAANQFAHPVRLIEGAIGAESRDSVSFVSNGPWGHVSTPRSSDAATGGVRMYTLPELLASVGWTAPAFVKMDVEGSELQAVTGAQPWFAGGHRPTILYEANAFTLDWFGATPADLNRAFDALGYHRYELDDNGTLRAPGNFEPRCLVDYVVSDTELAHAAKRSFWSLCKLTLRALQNESPVARKHTWRALGLGS